MSVVTVTFCCNTALFNPVDNTLHLAILHELEKSLLLRSSLNDYRNWKIETWRY